MTEACPDVSVAPDRDLAQIRFDLGHIAQLLEDTARAYAPDNISPEAKAWLRVNFLAGLVAAAAAEVGVIASKLEGEQ